MELRRYKDILAIKDEQNIWGFHSKNLQVARLDQSAWQAFPQSSDLENQVRNPKEILEAFSEIKKWNAQVDVAAKQDASSQKVRSFSINISQKCNLRCTYCAAGGDGTYGSSKGKVDLSVTKRQLQKLLNEVNDGESFFVNFFGGEPLLHPEAIRSVSQHVQLITAGRNIHVHYGITTNGTLINEETVALLASLQCHVTVSMDGPPSINDKTRPTVSGNGSSDKTLRGIHLLADSKEKLGSLQINCVFGAHNIRVFESYQYFRNFPVDQLNFIYAVSEEDNVYSDIFVQEMERVLKSASSQGETELRRLSFLDQNFVRLDEQLKAINHCGAGKSFLISDTRGDLHACPWFINDTSEKVGEGVQFSVEKLAEYADPMIEKNNCGTCWARHLCGGGCMFVHQEKSGDKFTKDMEFCKRMRGLAALSIVQYGQTRETMTENEKELA